MTMSFNALRTWKIIKGTLANGKKFKFAQLEQTDYALSWKQSILLTQ